jgi:thiazolylpeptide-type bacteriocin precursor
VLASASAETLKKGGKMENTLQLNNELRDLDFTTFEVEEIEEIGILAPLMAQGKSCCSTSSCSSCCSSTSSSSS